MKLIEIPDSKRESARRYINNNLGPTELLALCDDMFDVICLKKDKTMECTAERLTCCSCKMFQRHFNLKS